MKKVSLFMGVAVIMIAASCNNQSSDTNQSKEMKQDTMKMDNMKMDSMKMDSIMHDNRQMQDSSKK